MAFSFGASAPAFGATSTPAFGAPTSAPGFGAQTSTPGFGTTAAAPAFGAASAPATGFGAAFGAPATSTGFGFGASQPSLFGAATSQPTATPAVSGGFGFGASQPATGFGGFGAVSSPSPFGVSSTPAAGTSIFGTPSSTPSLGTSLFNPQPQAQQQQLALQQQQQPRAALTYKTKFEELGPSEQQFLNNIQQQISSFRDDARHLDNDTRLHDAAELRKTLDEDTAALQQSLQNLMQTINTEDEALTSFREKVLSLLRSTESAIRLYQRCKVWRELPQLGPAQMIPQVVQEQLAQPVQLPNPFLEQAVAAFMETLEQYHMCVSELERVLPTSSAAGALMAGVPNDEASYVQALPTIISHLHDYFVHVAARLDGLHTQVQRAKAAFLTRRRMQGDMTDPFEDARRYHHLNGNGSFSGGSGSGSYGHPSKQQLLLMAGPGAARQGGGGGGLGTPGGQQGGIGSPLGAVGGAAGSPFGAASSVPFTPTGAMGGVSGFGALGGGFGTPIAGGAGDMGQKSTGGKNSAKKR